MLSELVNERGVDVVLDVVGGDDVLHLWRSLSRAGRFATGGAIAGPMTDSSSTNTTVAAIEILLNYG